MVFFILNFLEENEKTNEDEYQMHLDFLSENFNKNLISKSLYEFLESKYNPSKSYISPLSKKKFNLEEETMIDLEELSEANKNVCFSPIRNTDSTEPNLYLEYQRKFQFETEAKQIKREIDESIYQRTGIKGRLIK